MKPLSFLGSLPLFVLLLGACQSGSKKTAQSEQQAKEAPYEVAIDSLLARMTLREKIGQMTQLDFGLVRKEETYSDSANFFELDTAKARHIISKYHVGSFLNGWAISKENWYQYLNKLQKINMETHRLSIPMIYGVDHVHGANYLREGTMFPHNFMLACSFNRELAKQMAHITGKETAGLGHHWVFAPVLDIGRNKYWPRFYETLGEDPYLASELGAAYVHALQNNPHTGPYRQAATGKHFLAYSDPKNGWDRSPTDVSEQTLKEVFCPSFQAAIDTGLKTIMVNSGELNGVPVHASKKMLTDLLRKQMGFEGVVVTDWADILSLQEGHKVAASYKEAIKLAINAGIDMSMTPLDTTFCTQLYELVKEGTIPEKRIDTSVRRILRLKYQLNLFEKPYPTKKYFEQVGSKAHHQAAVAAARQSIVLAKNQDSLLPLKKPKKLLLVGPNANNKRAFCGGWSVRWEPKAKHEPYFPEKMPTFYQALQKQFPESQVVLGEAEDLSSQARGADAIIVAAGEMPYSEGFGSIQDLELPQEQLRLIRKANASGTPVVLTMISSRPRTIAGVFDELEAFIVAGNPGQGGPQALAEILSGQTNPSGKMAFTYPYKQGHMLNYDHKPSAFSYLHHRSEEVNRFTIAPFGHGLSYTSFEYSNLQLSDTSLSKTGSITASVTVRNTGKRAGKEAVLFFLNDEYASVVRPVKELKYFEKISLETGQSKTVKWRIRPGRDLSFPKGWSGGQVVEYGQFKVMVEGLEQHFSLEEAQAPQGSPSEEAGA